MWYKSYHINLYVKRCQYSICIRSMKTKTNTEISFSFWLTLFYSIPRLALTERQTDGRTDRQRNEFILVVLAAPWRVPPGTLTSRGLEEPAHASRGLFLINTLLLYPSLSPYSQTDDWMDGRTDRQRNKYTCFAWAGGTCPRFAWAGWTFFPIVLLCQFLLLMGNRICLYILLCTWSTIQLWCCVSFFGSGGK